MARRQPDHDHCQHRFQKLSSLQVNGILPVFWTRSVLSKHHPRRFFQPRKPACQTREPSGTLLIEKETYEILGGIAECAARYPGSL
jgi:hypothetical protein